MVSNRQFDAPFGMVDVFVFGGRDVSCVPVDPLCVVPVDPSQGREFDVLDGVPRPLVGSVDQLSLVQAVHAFSERVIEGVSNRSDRRDGTDLVESFRVTDAGVLGPCVAVKPNSA